MQVKTRPKITRSNTWSICKRELRISFQATVRGMAEEYARNLSAYQRRDAGHRETEYSLSATVERQAAELARPLPSLARWLRRVFQIKP